MCASPLIQGDALLCLDGRLGLLPNTRAIGSWSPCSLLWSSQRQACDLGFTLSQRSDRRRLWVLAGGCSWPAWLEGYWPQVVSAAAALPRPRCLAFSRSLSYHLSFPHPFLQPRADAMDLIVFQENICASESQGRFLLLVNSNLDSVELPCGKGIQRPGHTHTHTHTQCLLYPSLL